MKSKKFKIVTLGCRTNQYESQAYTDQLLQMGYSAASSEEVADLCIVNTCTVTHSADSSSRRAIRSLERENPGAKIIVTGCLADRVPQEIKGIEGVGLVVLNKEKEALISLALPEEENVPEFSIKSFEAHTRAFVKVQDGCNSFCTYCIIPYVRGRSRSRKVMEIEQEVKTLIESGFKEVVITGINVGDFDGNPGPEEKPVRLFELVQTLDRMEGLQRLRISSIDPDEVDENLLRSVVDGTHTCPSMHIVLQSGSNAILKRMNRKYTKEIFLETIEKLKKARPDFTFTTDVIVGFPGETEQDFNETLQLVQEVRFAKVHMFPYSSRPRTKAATYPNQVPVPIITERKQRLLRAAEKAAFDLREEYVGRKMKVLVEENRGEGLCMGHTDNFLSVLLPAELVQQNKIYDVLLKENSTEGLLGELCL